MTAPISDHTDRTGAGMLDVLAGFIQELRSAGLPVSLTENLDAMQAVQHIPLDDREAFKYALAATLVADFAGAGAGEASRLPHRGDCVRGEHFVALGVTAFRGASAAFVVDESADALGRK